MASLRVKFDTGGKKCSTTTSLQTPLSWSHWQKSHPTGLDVSNTRLTAYNGTQIPLFWLFHGPIIWQPGSLCAQPCQINSCWYVADTPGPAILGLPSCERLEVVKMNCAVQVIQDTSCLPGPTPAPPTPKKTVPIKSMEDIIKNSQIGSKAKA